MSDREEEGFGFAPEHDAPIPYMTRIRDYYQALGYGAPYRWAHYAEVPFAPQNARRRRQDRCDSYRSGSPTSNANQHARHVRCVGQHHAG